MEELSLDVKEFVLIVLEQNKAFVKPISRVFLWPYNSMSNMLRPWSKLSF
jgi:hypothetical protein